ncbi:L,D-transpeptidase [Lactiplantibacillus argentoratensis]|uniref:L,D-transpeptidase n=1 Tax=Lactiplantibacillus argentoratensis TaxID=271881 RepID=UPI00398B2BCF
MKKKSVLILLIMMLAIGMVLAHGIDKVHANKTVHTSNIKITKTKSHSEVMRSPINWHDSSEIVPYPDIKKYPDMWIHVSIEKQRMYLVNHHSVLYTMYASTGVPTKSRETPKGTYHVQAERGKYFYSTSEGEGAYYWVSWLNHGEFLFHSTPVNSQGHYIKSVAEDLGKKPSSHGCVHLSIADSKWIYENIPYGTKVVID